MWPKMLFELLPHVGRLIPMAERFLATRATHDQEEQAALTAISENLRDELGKVSGNHAGIQRALKDQGEQVSEIAVQVTRVRMGVESIEGRLTRLENGFTVAEETATRAEATAARVGKLFGVTIALLVVLAALLGVVLWRIWPR